MGICFPRRICWFSIFLVVQKQFAWKIDLTYLGFWCCRKREKHFLGILVGLQRTSRPLLWWLQHLQNWRHLQKRASVSVPMVGQTAGVTFSGGTIPVPFLHSWSAQGCRHVSGRSWAWAWVGREQMCFHPPQPLLDRAHWTSSQESPEETKRTIFLSHFRPLWHAPNPTFGLRYWHKRLKNFRGSRSNFHRERTKLCIIMTLHSIV